MNKRALCITLLTASAVASPCFAQTPPPQQPLAPPAPLSLSVRTAIRQAAENNPSLRAALLDAQGADSLLSAAEDQYPLMLQLDANGTHLTSPRLSDPLNPSVLTSTSDSVVLGGELTKTFPIGTSLGFRLEGGWIRQRSQLFPGSSDTITIGPGYSLSGRLTVRQPLLGGAGTDVGEAEVRTAQIDRTRVVKQQDRVASEMLRDVVTSYWELWYADEALRIDSAARELAETERKQQLERLSLGAAAPVEIYPFETRVAELDEVLLTSQLERERRALNLGLQLGNPGRGAAQMTTADRAVPDPTQLDDEEALVQQAMQSAPELAELDAQIAQAAERQKTAGESERQRLDLTGWMQLDGLGNQRVPPAFEQFATLGAFSAQLGLVYQLPLTGARYSKQQLAARRAYDAALARREALEQRIRSELTILIRRANATARRAQLADRTVGIATKQRAAAKERFELGDNIAIEIQRAEDSLRRAKLRAARARVDWAVAIASIEHTTGRLLLRHGDAVERAASTLTALQLPNGPF